MKQLRELWRMLGHIMGEDAYSRYCEHLRRRHPERSLPTAREFYKALLEDKYSKPSRCC